MNNKNRLVSLVTDRGVARSYYGQYYMLFLRNPLPAAASHTHYTPSHYTYLYNVITYCPPTTKTFVKTRNTHSFGRRTVFKKGTGAQTSRLKCKVNWIFSYINSCVVFHRHNSTPISFTSRPRSPFVLAHDEMQ